MKLFRFMGKSEFKKYQEGKKLINTTIHLGKTNSIGFCFLNLDEYTPEEALHFLSGVATFDVCAVFETNVKMEKTYGIYAKPIERKGNILEDLMNLFSDWDNSFKANEYCTKEYSNKNFKLIKYSKNIWNQWNPLDEQQNLKWEEYNNEIQTTKRNKETNGEGIATV